MSVGQSVFAVYDKATQSTSWASWATRCGRFGGRVRQHDGDPMALMTSRPTAGCQSVCRARPAPGGFGPTFFMRRGFKDLDARRI